MANCSECKGSGKCRSCKGSGTIPQSYKNKQGGWETTDSQCPTCGGSKACQPCSGTGRA